MYVFAGRGILLDIEGTTSSVRFVYDVMFPFVRRELESYLAGNWGASDLRAACELIARDAGYESFADWSATASTGEQQCQLVAGEIVRLMDGDIKATGLKQLQGLIWKSGFESGELQAHVYEDVPTALTAWNEADIDVRIYSSGSVAAQKLFFGHTIAGDLLHCFRGHYDTTTGPKKEMASYEQITAAFGFPANDILFISDLVAELDAARTVGMQTALSLRPDNPDIDPLHGHTVITSFAEVRIFAT
ncbi:MAG: acireductone synthase [Planctomycetaceae bacterium]|nr:acireductone synthase [Planctomycetaceae bacterium]HRX82960.1 acireductone synthase [Pirellulaceae bacterium]